MHVLPPPLTPLAGAKGYATDHPASLKDRVTTAWEQLAVFAERCDLEAPARAKGRTGRAALAPVGRWPDSRGVSEVVDDARSGRVHRIDQDDYERRLRASHDQATPAEVVASIRSAGDEVSRWLGSIDDDRDGLLLTASPLGALPVRTYLHAAVYQLAVVALDLEVCAAEAVPAELLELGLVALVDSIGCLAARRGLHASLCADTRSEADANRGVWGFGASDGTWTVAALDEPVGPTVTGSIRTILDITAGRTANVPGLVSSGALRLHDIPGLLHLAPLIDEVPGIPGASALRAATASIGAASAVLSVLRRPFSPRS